MNDFKTIALSDKIFLFVKAQCSAGCGTVVDYGTMLFLTEIVGFHYAYSIIVGGFLGAIVNFSINMRWTFRGDASYKNSLASLILKFSFVVLISVLLKSSGTHLITIMSGIDYKICRIIIDVIVSVLINYNLQKNWVFKKK